MGQLENGKVILEIYVHFDSWPGKALCANNFLAVGLRRRRSASELQDGLEYAAKVKWIEKTENGYWSLTECGFAAMKADQHSQATARITEGWPSQA